MSFNLMNVLILSINSGVHIDNIQVWGCVIENVQTRYGTMLQNIFFYVMLFIMGRSVFDVLLFLNQILTL